MHSQYKQRYQIKYTSIPSPWAFHSSKHNFLKSLFILACVHTKHLSTHLHHLHIHKTFYFQGTPSILGSYTYIQIYIWNSIWNSPFDQFSFPISGDSSGTSGSARFQESLNNLLNVSNMLFILYSQFGFLTNFSFHFYPHILLNCDFTPNLDIFI